MIPNLSSTAQSSLGRAEGGKERSEGGGKVEGGQGRGSRERKEWKITAPAAQRPENPVKANQRS